MPEHFECYVLSARSEAACSSTGAGPTSGVYSRWMPTVLRTGPYRFFFYSADRDEPPHVHVEREELHAKFWLEPVRLQESGGFRRSEINRLRQLVEENKSLFLRRWDEYFTD